MKINETVFINEAEFKETFIQASGPGGQNVNKVASAVQLRFNVIKSPSLSEEVKGRVLKLARHLVTKEGVLIITARRFRTQELNRQDARERLGELIRRALCQPKKRIATLISKNVKEKRLDRKTKVRQIKKLRQPIKKNESE